ncbi:3D domain-containing protein, partial [Deinococcus sp. 6YEL10]
TPIRGKTAIARSTAYNSVPGQTDSTPFITATGTRTRPGVVALSRDLLRTFPYGTKVMIEDLSGKYTNMLKGRVFIVEDTMAARKTNSVDIWMATRSEALNWGARQIRITAVR